MIVFTRFALLPLCYQRASNCELLILLQCVNKLSTKIGKGCVLPVPRCSPAKPYDSLWESATQTHILSVLLRMLSSEKGSDFEQCR